jgi:hypothetical protein
MSTNPTQAQIAAEAAALSAQYGIPASVIMSVIQSESNYNQFDSSGNPLLNVPVAPATSTSGAVGLMQVMQNSVSPPLTYDQVSNDWQANMQAGASILSKDIQNANPGQTPGQDGWSAAQTAAGLPAYGGFVKNDPSAYVNKIMTNAGMPGYPQVGPPSSSTANGPLLPGVSGAAVEALPVTGQPITDTADLYPSYVITEGLDANPWWLMKGYTENPWLKQVPAPVTFEVMLPNQKMLSNTKAGNTSGTISIQLNASVASFEVQAGHVVNKGLSRTGMHITMWGQEADLISGEANTGAFMNALGITSFLSVSNISSQLQRQIISAFSNSSKQESNVDFSMTSNDLRIAARDAFMELLALFKANGVVWFRNSTTGSGTGATNPVGVDAFSPQTGLSNYQMNARTNDVMARGQVIMKFRNSMYLGYFKSLEYEMEAERPFYWKFRFVFQVEKTLTLNYIPMYTTANLQPVSTPVTTTISYVPLQTLSLPGSVSKS